MQFNRAECEKQYKQVSDQQIQNVGATHANLQRLLRSIDFVGWSTHEESGRLDRRALTRFASGSTNIFSRREIKEAETSAVSVLIDCSGSMRDGDRITVAQQFAIHLSKLLNKSRVPFAVTGFTRGKYQSAQIGTDHAYSEKPLFIPFKPWGKSLQSSIHSLGAIDKTACGGTPDYSATMNALMELNARTEKRKILFVLTDASGYAVAHMEHVQSVADKLGITIVAIGIQTKDVVKCFVNAINVKNLDDLASTSFSQLLKAVERKRK